MQAATLGYNRDGGTQGVVRRSCTSARKETPTYEPCWCKEHNTSWARLERTVTCDAGTETGGARWKEWKETSGDRGGTQISGAAASAMGQWRGLRSAAQSASG